MEDIKRRENSKEKVSTAGGRGGEENETLRNDSLADIERINYSSRFCIVIFIKFSSHFEFSQISFLSPIQYFSFI